MESWKAEIVESLSNKYHQSEYQLMEYLGIRYENGLYYVGESKFDSYYSALKAADIEISNNKKNKQRKEKSVQSSSSSLLGCFLKGILFLLFSVSLFFVILPIIAQIMVMVFGKMGGSIVGYIADLISIFIAFLISSVIVSKL